MGILFPIINFILLFLLSGNLSQKIKFDWRHNFVLTTIAWGTLIVVGTEILSILGWITPWGIAGYWSLTIILMVWLARRYSWKFSLPSIKISSLNIGERIQIGAIVFIVVLIAVVAFKAPPNTYDSMTYHMSRVVHWVQNKTLAPYPTNILRQNVYTPFAEYGILHLQVLSGSDRFANFVQWFSMVISVLGASLIARYLGAGRQGQILAAGLTATIPMGVLQGSSTQTDYVTALWLVCLINSGFFLLEQKKWRYAIFLGLSLGLAALTKGTSYFYSMPFMVLFLTDAFKIYKKSTLKIIAVITAATLILNAGFYARNIALQQSLLSKQESAEISNTEMNLPLLISNIAKNLSLHWGTPSEEVNALIEKAFHRFHAWLGVNPSDGRTSWDPDTVIHIGEMSFHEDNAGNLLHFLVNTLCILLFLFALHTKKPGVLGWYLIAFISGFILFNVYMKWAPWHSRYHLPLFVLFAPWTAVILDKIENKKIVAAIALFFILTSMPWVWGNKTRSFFKKRNVFNTPRLEQYFYNKHGAFFSYHQAVNQIKSMGCTDIGLILGADGWEYPYWSLLKENYKPFRLEYLKVTNISKDMPYPLGPFMPCVIIDAIGEKPKVELDGKTFVRVRQFAYTSLLLEDTDGTLAQKSLIYHFNKLLEDARKFYLFMSQNPLTSLSEERKLQAAELLSAQIANAQQLDFAALDEVYPLLGFHLKDKFAQGLTLIRNGLKDQNKEQLIKGQQSLAIWNIWFEKNISAIQKTFEKFQSEIK